MTLGNVAAAKVRLTCGAKRALTRSSPTPAPHVAQAGADIDRRSGSQWHRIGGAGWRGGAASEKPENLVRQKA
jgi:hypothetical protein